MPSSVSGGGGNVPEIKVHASLDNNKDAKVVLSEAKGSIESNSVFTQNTSDAKVQDLIKQNTAGKFENIADATVTSTVTKYLNGTSLAQIFNSALQSSFQAIGYDVKTVHSNESASGHNGEGGTDASGQEISGNTQGYQQAIDTGIANQITNQLQALSEKVLTEYNTKLNSAINQAHNELSNDRSQNITGGSGNNPDIKGADIDTSQDAEGTLHTYDSAAGGKDTVGSAGYEATMTALQGKGAKVKTATVDGKEVQIVTYKDGDGKHSVIVDDEGNTHNLQKSKTSGNYMTDEGLAAMRKSTGDENLDAGSVKFRKRSVTDADTGTTSKQSVAIVKKEDGKHRYEMNNDAKDSNGYVDNQVDVTEAVITKDGIFRKKQFVSGESVDTIMKDGGQAEKSNGQRTIKTGDGVNINVKDNAGIQSKANDIKAENELAQFKADAAAEDVQVQVVDGKVQMVSFEDGQMKTQTFDSLQEAKDSFNTTQFDKGSISRHDEKDDVHTEIRPEIPTTGDDAFSTTDGVNISPKAKNVHFKRSEWNHDWSKDASKVQEFKDNAHSVEDVFNIMLSQNGLDASKFKFNDSMRNMLISNNPSIFDNNGHVYQGASFEKRLDLPSVDVIKRMCAEE